jgi:hypothetical protein
LGVAAAAGTTGNPTDPCTNRHPHWTADSTDLRAGCCTAQSA